MVNCLLRSGFLGNRNLLRVSCQSRLSIGKIDSGVLSEAVQRYLGIYLLFEENLSKARLWASLKFLPPAITSNQSYFRWIESIGSHTSSWWRKGTRVGLFTNIFRIYSRTNAAIDSVLYFRLIHFLNFCKSTVL